MAGLSINLTAILRQLQLSPKPKECQLKESCNILDPQHFEEYNHQHLTDAMRETSRKGITTVPIYYRAQYATIEKQMSILIENSLKPISPVEPPKALLSPAEKLEAAKPYNFFLSATVSNKLALEETLCMSFAELLDKSLGEIESSVQINFCVDLPWLLEHYSNAGAGGTPLLLLYGNENLCTEEKFSNVTYHYIKPEGIGLHHTKMSLLGYNDGSMRVIISTANLVPIDWSNNTQGFWISPKLHKINNKENMDDGESPTGFRKDLIDYLQCYKIAELDYWTERLCNSDCSSINVCLVYSVPGLYNLDDARYGYLHLGDLLSQHINNASLDDTIIAQSPSVGKFGPNPNDWAGGEFLKNASAWIRQPISSQSRTSALKNTPSWRKAKERLDFRFVFATHENVRCSMGGFEETSRITMCTYEMYVKQQWLRSILCKWKADERHRTRCMPHIKTYCRTAGPAIGKKKPEGLRWFLLTSANMSKNAWGSIPFHSPKNFRVGSYELGVLFLPKFILKTDLLPLIDCEAGPAFSTPYDIPLVPYDREDKIFFTDLFAEAVIKFHEEEQKYAEKMKETISDTSDVEN